MPGHDIIVIGASAGGVEALTQLVADLPPNLPAAIFVVIHFPAWGKSILPQLLNREGPLHADHAKNDEKIEHGRIYVAPPDYHLLVKRGYIRLVQGPKENNARPAVDPLFRTAARAYKRRVVGVVLSGTLDDGTAGLIDLKRQGGVAVVQDPTDAFFSGMPKNAIENADVDFILPLSSIAPVLVSLAHEPVAEEGASTVPSESEFETDLDVVEVDGAALRERGKPGTHSSFTCPDCGGSLFQLNERGLLQYRCRVGHAYSAEALVAGQSQAQEEALWAAIRSLEERAELMYKMAKYARDRNNTLSAKRYEAQAKEAEQRSDFIRQGLFQGQLPATVPLAKSEESGESADGNGNSHSPFKIVVLAASEGGLRALSHILPAFRPDFPAAIIVVQKPDSHSSSSLITDALNRPTTLPLKQAQEGEPLQPGMVYVAPPNQHLLVTPDGTFCLSGAVLVDFARPSTDLLLQSLAASFKERAIAVILSGLGSDGATGVQAIHKMGGLAIAQNESTSEFFEMPRAAIETGKVDFVLPLNEIGSTLANLVVSQSWLEK